MATAIETISSSGPYSWTGSNDAQYVDKIYDWIGTLDDTTYPSWTPSTTAKTILATTSGVASFTIPDRTKESYYLVARWGMNFEYNSGTTMTYAPVRFVCFSLQAYYQYPSNYSQYLSGEYTAYSNTTLLNGYYLVYYNSSGTLTGATNAYGPAYVTSAPSWTTAISGNSVTVTLNRLALFARCNTSYFTTDRAADIDTANSTIRCRYDILKGPAENFYNGRYRKIADILNDNWDF